ncbi:NAD(P)/FAD-dependent oxidoreductase [Sandaracinobacteroides saxicola]|uniref:FAD-binding oxidoreductase n=1 Tax=Sandaracinobacteroides saxicola TaxID=2759707 RepID=A0A7G5ILJ7_9SPHN|nr:FAD-binding oxidoreductase [Sandaracinobacteroides saxicola]QMW24239.1 FAD-binding oxidoreductase [Sandaracinobacteroides saxicola]
MSGFDIAIVGAGIGGASLAWALLRRAPGTRVLLLEAEEAPGYHTTGRSAAFYAETYGGPTVQPLTSASKAFFMNPPAGFCDTALVAPRGAMHICNTGSLVKIEGIDDPPGMAPVQGPAALEALEAEFVAGGVAYQRLGPAGVKAKLPWLRESWATMALWEPGCADIDVAALHQSYLRGAKAAGMVMATRARLEGLVRRDGVWRLATTAGGFEAAVVVNAAGAWADDVAAMADAVTVGIAPLRRTIVVAEVEPAAPADMPVVMDAGGALYFKPDGGKLWISPHDESPDVAHDVQPDEIDMGIAIDRFEQLCDWPVKRISARWAGLRCFAGDRLPVIGFDARAEGFFWCAGQGGWGIQTAPAAADLGAALLLGETPDLDAGPYAAQRFAL